MKPINALLSAMLALLLTGCWTSDAPLMPDDAMDKPPLSGTYSRFEGEVFTGDRYVVSLEGAEYQVDHSEFGDAAKPAYFISFDALAEELYLAQIVNMNGKMEAYRLFRISDGGGEAFDMDFDCAAPETGLPQVESDGTDCKFASYDSLKKAAMARAAEYSEKGSGAKIVSRFERILD
ncbi:hypothetical protein DXH95_05530 [Sphingorhabdus pulchriflava]|uniref:Lipoprotein n=1 Tax=Sphingorhabdus pulchriflava TaxID=2292257 RepID=A0A371BGY8_9SPHN|nr:hypothetical protein [Sphingorhabdus pulchriflava]RDV06859.1 hypothetical protein DXH95_05530 [Sphingorhabdus pulchriflava]